MKARILEIKRFAVHDGDGIRTTVFFKGCPLKCVWCHNPEGIDFKPQMAYWENKCISCGECINVCPQKAHEMKNGVHIFERTKCVKCGECEKVCLNSALTFYGKEMTVDELLPILLEDKDFYENSQGGVTLSGGECLCQADFCEALLKELKANGVHTAVDTCGFVPRSAIDKVMPYTDIFLYDLKAYEETVHEKYTRHSNKKIIENLQYIDACGKKTAIRIPYVPECNRDQIEYLSEFLKRLKNVTKVEVLPYHNYAGSKYKALNMLNTLPNRIPTQEEIENAVSTLKKTGITIM